MSKELLKYIVEASKPNASEKYPDGFCYLEAGHVDGATALHQQGFIEANPNSRNDQGAFPVRPLPSAVAAMSGELNNPAPVQAAPVSVKIETGIAIPERKHFGRQTEGTDKVTQYGFANMPVNASFFIPQSGDKPVHRAFAAVVSSANKKLFPMNFVIREWEGGARVWRIEDLKEARPTRARKSKQEPQPTTQPGPQFPGGFAAPGHTGFGHSPQPFTAPAAGPFVEAPAGFGAAPSPFSPPAGGGGVDWGNGPGFDPGLPDFEA